MANADAVKSAQAQQRALKKAARRAAFIQEVAKETMRQLVPVAQALLKLHKYEGYLASRRISLDADQHRGFDTTRSWQLVEEGEQAVGAIKQELAALVEA